MNRNHSLPIEPLKAVQLPQLASPNVDYDLLALIFIHAGQKIETYYHTEGRCDLISLAAGERCAAHEVGYCGDVKLRHFTPQYAAIWLTVTP